MKVSWGQGIIAMVEQSLQAVWKKEENLTQRYSCVPAFSSIWHLKALLDLKVNDWLNGCFKGGHTSALDPQSFLCLEHWHCSVFTETQVVLVLLKHQAPGDNFRKSVPPGQFTRWLPTGLKSDHVWLCGTLQRKAKSAERQFHSFWCFPFHRQVQLSLRNLAPYT